MKKIILFKFLSTLFSIVIINLTLEIYVRHALDDGFMLDLEMMKYSKRGIKWGEIMFNSPDWLVDASFNSLSKPFIWRAVNCRPVLGIY